MNENDLEFTPVTKKENIYVLAICKTDFTDCASDKTLFHLLCNGESIAQIQLDKVEYIAEYLDDSDNGLAKETFEKLDKKIINQAKN